MPPTSVIRHSVSTYSAFGLRICCGSDLYLGGRRGAAQYAEASSRIIVRLCPPIARRQPLLTSRGSPSKMVILVHSPTCEEYGLGRVRSELFPRRGCGRT